jgi:hypothetical protein
MTDIVERLKERIWDDEYYEDIFVDAADEIERLRELKNLARHDAETWRGEADKLAQQILRAKRRGE